MHSLAGLLFLPASAAGLLLAGYPVAARLSSEDAPSRLALGLLAGLLVQLFMVAAVNLCFPLSGPWAWACLSPMLLTVAHAKTRRQLVADIITALPRRKAAVLIGGIGGFLAILLWPLLGPDAVMHFDGTANHDSFFWITGAEHLTQHSYLQAPASSPTHPLMGQVRAITGLSPAWGRMGAEGLLALASSVTGSSTLALYLPAFAALFLPWLAAVFLTTRTFVCDRLSGVAVLGLALLQPLFAFYYLNGNLPNLVGILAGTVLIVATERGLGATQGGLAAAGPWLALVALALHGLMCSYPELLPFMLPAGGLLAGRHLLRPDRPRSLRPVALLGLAAVAGLAVNPVTTIRAVRGLFNSYASASADAYWGNIFRSTPPAEFLPTLVTLSTKTGHVLGTAGGWLATALLAAILLYTLSRARDRIGVLLACSGALALGVFTAVSGFSYGWQKTVQFSGVFLAALLPVGALQVLSAGEPLWTSPRRAAKVGALAVTVFFGFALVIVHLDVEKWSSRKALSPDWLTLRDFARDRLDGAAVLVDAASFPRPFFHGMWAAYFLREPELYYTTRDEQGTGYFEQRAATEPSAQGREFAAVLTGREWADVFDPDSPRLLAGREYALLPRANRVLDLQGLTPASGVPEASTAHFSLTLMRHSPEALSLEISPQPEVASLSGSWSVSVRNAAGREESRATFDGPPPWRCTVPLAAGAPQKVAFDFSSAQGTPAGDWPFVIRQLRLSAPNRQP